MSEHPYTHPSSSDRLSVSSGGASYDPVKAVHTGITPIERNYYTGRGEFNAEDNLQPRFELFLLGDGEKKVTETPDTRKCHPPLVYFHVTHFCYVFIHSVHPQFTSLRHITPYHTTLGLSSLSATHVMYQQTYLN